MKTAIDFIQEAHQVYDKAVRSTRGFNREAEAAMNGLLRMAELSRAGAVGRPAGVGSAASPSLEQLAERAFEANLEASLDDATRSFFRGGSFSQDVISEQGMRIEKTRSGIFPDSSSLTGVGSHGPVTVLRDLSCLKPKEERSYVALNEGTDSLGGTLTPTGFQYSVLQRMKQYDRLFDAARWIFAPGTGVFNMPIVDATDSGIDAAVLAENSAITQGPNPVFANIQFPKPSLWSTPQFVYSLQLQQDAGVPFVQWFRDIFALSFARGMGANFVSVLLAGASSALTTASPTAVTGAEIYNMIDAVDDMYAENPGAGFLMNKKTYLYVSQITTSGGQLMFPPQRDAQGRPVVANKPVYICPSLADISAGAKPIVFGDLKRLAVRSVTESFEIFRYEEKFMPNHQKALQARWRADAQFVAASASDQPLQFITCHS